MESMLEKAFDFEPVHHIRHLAFPSPVLPFYRTPLDVINVPLTKIEAVDVVVQCLHFATIKKTNKLIIWAHTDPDFIFKCKMTAVKWQLTVGCCDWFGCNWVFGCCCCCCARLLTLLPEGSMTARQTFC